MGSAIDSGSDRGQSSYDASGYRSRDFGPGQKIGDDIADARRETASECEADVPMCPQCAGEESFSGGTAASAEGANTLRDCEPVNAWNRSETVRSISPSSGRAGGGADSSLGQPVSSGAAPRVRSSQIFRILRASTSKRA
jgi:hypothetical protein